MQVDLVKGQAQRAREAEHGFWQSSEGLRNPLIGDHPLGYLPKLPFII